MPRTRSSPTRSRGQLAHGDAAFAVNVTCAAVLLSVLLRGIALERSPDG
ncbi:hypothetical protein [Streptomyces boluensis]|uniref:Uncharacterized protein n=1 Tax=Streptomyces boluensis TaxID=1775135 RepID=A0A964UJ93_9ACTN|nr:hypothetical protein [Streptomyces boluensis]NBE50174.1 hypothetical protein [Streptomyces boluensis]